MKREKKVEAIDKLKTALSEAKGAYFADFQGMDVATAIQLRTRCREAGVEFHVVKDTLVRRAIEKTTLESLGTALTGPTAIATSTRDEVAAAKIIADFCKEFERPVLKAGIVDGKVVTKEEAGVLARLPGIEVLLARFAGGLKSPVQKLHTALSGPMKKLAMALKQVGEQKA